MTVKPARVQAPKEGPGVARTSDRPIGNSNFDLVSVFGSVMTKISAADEVLRRHRDNNMDLGR